MDNYHNIEYLILDAANTIIYKPSLYDNIIATLNEFGHTNIKKDHLVRNHRILSEIVKFPDRTDINFYSHFNSELLYSLGLKPKTDLLNAIYYNCSGLKWKAFDDCDILIKLNIPISILSNFSSNLKHILNDLFGDIFDNIFISEEFNASKPSEKFFIEVLNHLKINPDKILYIGDSLKLDYEPGVSIGMSSLIIDRDYIYPSHSYIIRSLSELNQLIIK